MIKIINTKNYIKVSSIQKQIKAQKMAVENDAKQVEQYKKEIGNCDDCGLTLELKVNYLKFWMEKLKEDKRILNNLILVLNLE